MRGVKSEDLLAIIDFLYFGEANVFQENLDSFLAIAEELQLKGLMGNVSSDVANQTKTEPSIQEEKDKILNLNKPSMSKPSLVTQTNLIEESSNIGQENKIVALTSYFSGDVQELDEKCNSMMEKTLKKNAHGQLLYKCVLCGKEAISGDLKKHIEANHLEGITIPCDFCEKTFRSRDSFGKHLRHFHKSN